MSGQRVCLCGLAPALSACHGRLPKTKLAGSGLAQLSPTHPEVGKHPGATRSLESKRLAPVNADSTQIRRGEETGFPQLTLARRRERTVKFGMIAAQQWLKPGRAWRTFYPPRPAPARGVVRWIHVSPNEIATVVQTAQQLVRDDPPQGGVQPRGARSAFGNRARHHA